MSGQQQPRRWAGLPPAERRRRQAQSEADKTRTAIGASATEPISDAERHRRQAQADAARARAAHDAEVDEAVWRTVYGGDINFMDKHDW